MNQARLGVKSLHSEERGAINVEQLGHYRHLTAIKSTNCKPSSLSEVDNRLVQQGNQMLEKLLRPGTSLDIDSRKKKTSNRHRTDL